MSTPENPELDPTTAPVSLRENEQLVCAPFSQPQRARNAPQFRITLTPTFRIRAKTKITAQIQIEQSGEFAPSLTPTEGQPTNNSETPNDDPMLTSAGNSPQQDLVTSIEAAGEYPAGVAELMRSVLPFAFPITPKQSRAPSYFSIQQTMMKTLKTSPAPHKSPLIVCGVAPKEELSLSPLSLARDDDSESLDDTKLPVVSLAVFYLI